MLEYNKYRKVSQDVAASMNIKGMSVMDLININAEVLTAYLVAQSHDDPLVTADLDGFKEYILEIVESAYKHHLSFLKADMEKYNANSI